MLRAEASHLQAHLWQPRSTCAPTALFLVSDQFAPARVRLRCEPPHLPPVRSLAEYRVSHHPYIPPASIAARRTADHRLCLGADPAGRSGSAGNNSSRSPRYAGTGRAIVADSPGGSESHSAIRACPSDTTFPDIRPTHLRYVLGTSECW